MTSHDVFDSQPRPRALFQDLSDQLIDAIAPLFPSYKIITANESVHEDEFDVLITTTQPFMRSTHLHIVSFGIVPRRTPAGIDHDFYEVTLTKRSLATELSIGPALASDLRELVQDDLYPIFHEQTEKRAVQLEVSAIYSDSGASSGTPPPPGVITPFMSAGGDSILSGAFTQYDESGESLGGRVWFLPAEVANPAAWVRMALREFSELDPERVPSAPDWWADEEWNTPRQMVARQNVKNLESTRDAQLVSINSQIQSARLEINFADSEAQQGMLRLLTQDGDELSDAVKEVLAAFGLYVKDMDEIYPPGDRLEDLQIEMSEHPDWIALVEIKGYSNGARVTDLAKLERHASRFANSNGGRLPDAKWQVVNAFKGISPSARPNAIPNDDELIDFHNNGGMLIDTRDLFAAWRTVQSGLTDPSVIRQSLFNTQMRWQGVNES